MNSKNKKFKLPDMTFSSSEKLNIIQEKEVPMNQSQDKVKQIEITDKFSLVSIDHLTSEVMQNDNLNIKLVNIKEIDLSGIQFILSLLSSSKAINLDLDMADSVKALIRNTGFTKIL